MGWTTNFIIADTKEEKNLKRELVQAGKAVDDAAFGYVEQVSKEERRRQREFERLSSISRIKYDSSIVSYDAENCRARLSNGKVIRIKRDQ